MTALLTAEELRGITERERKATAGPWHVIDPGFAHNPRVETDDKHLASVGNAEMAALAKDEWESNAEFIAHARSDIPALLAHIKELTRERDAYITDRDWWRAAFEASKHETETEKTEMRETLKSWALRFPRVAVVANAAQTFIDSMSDSLAAAEAQVKELTRERDEGRDAIVAALDEKELYRGRWLESVTPEEAKRMRESAEAQVKELTKALEEARRDAIAYIAKVAEATALSAGVGASEVAGTLISVLHANHSIQESFWQHGFDVFIDGNLSFGPENGCLTFLSAKGEVLTPTELVRRKYGEGKIQ